MERLLTTEEVADLLAVPKATLYRMRYVGSSPPAIRVGRHLRWEESALRAWLDSRRDEPRTAV